MTAVLQMPAEMQNRLWSHLLPPGVRTEQAAFLYIESKLSNGAVRLRAVDIELLHRDDFAFQESDYLELADDTRKRLIKKAHRSELSLAEAHSHPFPWPAEFSVADRLGLQTTVPHMFWRLPDRPYTAIVVSPGSFDGLVWLPRSDRPVPLTRIIAGELELTATQKSISQW